MSQDLTLLPEVQARHALRDRSVRMHVLAPYGAWLGRGALRVLRMKVNEDQSADLTVGYESYESCSAAPSARPRP
ncbi:MAG: hypothetical protein WA814_01205 [Candidatus Baltobacteraceae bacterium]